MQSFNTFLIVNALFNKAKAIEGAFSRLCDNIRKVPCVM